MKRIWAALVPYLPASVTIAAVLGSGAVFHREVENWFRGRPVLVGEPSRQVTVDAGPFRVGVVVRPSTPSDGENEVFFGVADRAGVLLAGARLGHGAEGTPLAPAEPLGDGQFRAVVELPERGAVHVAFEVEDPKLGKGQGSFVLEAGRLGVGQEGGLAEGVAYYTCPMHPSVRGAGPGTCPICSMDLVPVTHEELRTGAVRIDSRRRQLIGVKVQEVRPREMSVGIRATGIVAYDETGQVDVTARADGWVEQIFADFKGKAVKAGEPLLTLYSPEIRAAQLELQAAAKGHKAAEGTAFEETSSALHKAAREKLRLLGVTDVVAPVDGVVVDKMVTRGSPVMANQPMLRLGSLDPVWIETHLYEQDASLVTVGMTAAVSFPYLPGEPRTGTVSFIEPEVDAETRTIKARVSLANPTGDLRPGMYAEVELTARLGERLVVPQEAVIFAGPREVVFVDEGGGQMRPVQVRTGARDDAGIEILSGLETGQLVVTSGNFLLGAESRLRSAVDAW